MIFFSGKTCVSSLGKFSLLPLQLGAKNGNPPFSGLISKSGQFWRTFHLKKIFTNLVTFQSTYFFCTIVSKSYFGTVMHGHAQISVSQPKVCGLDEHMPHNLENKNIISYQLLAIACKKMVLLHDCFCNIRCHLMRACKRARKNLLVCSCFIYLTIVC